MNVVKVVVKESAIRSRAGEMCFMFGYGKVFTQNLVAFILKNYNIVKPVFCSWNNDSINNVCNLFVCYIFCARNVG